MTSAPLQFLGCGLFQLSVDCVILIQTIIYSRYFRMKSRHTSTRKEDDEEDHV
jgi:hypothetical protein